VIDDIVDDEITHGGKLVLPRRGRLRQTGEVDAVDRYYRPGIGWVMRQRLTWIHDALPAHPLSRVLEVGYGSGIFFYELNRHTAHLVGVEVHTNGAGVRRRVAADGITADLVQASGMALPFPAGTFEAVLIVSALEFMPDPLACLRESLRVTRPWGRVIAITPRVLAWADRLYRLLAGFDPETEFRGGRQRVQRALADPTLRAERQPRPRGLPRWLAPYELVVLRPEAAE
jgi:SAM-dependent methyltransferase